MFWNPSFRLIRPDDQLILDVRVSGMEPKPVDSPAPGGPTHLFKAVGNGPREIWLQFGPQQIVEYAKAVGSPREDQEHPLFVPRTDLIFQVADGELPFPATVEGLLGVLSRSALKTLDGDPEVEAVKLSPRSGVEPHALLAGDAPVPEAREAEALARRPRPAIAAVSPSSGVPKAAKSTPPLATATDVPVAVGGPAGAQPANSQVAMPRRLAVRPPGGGDVRMTHSASAVTHAGRTELWHSRLAVASTNPSDAPVEVEVPVNLTLLPQGPLTGPWSEAFLDNALTDSDCKDVADQIKGTNQAPPTPARLRRLILSALGGWLNLSGNWPAGKVKKLRVLTAQGRDQFQRKVAAGRLLPFGHKALLTATTVRKFESGSTRVAGLVTETVLQILEPVVSCDPEGGVNAQWPFASVEILHREPLLGNEVPRGGGVSTFEVAGLPFQFRCTGTDRSGQAIDFELPMLFAKLEDDAPFELFELRLAGWTAYTGADLPAGSTGRRTDYFTPKLNGQRLGVAVPPSSETLQALAAVADEAPVSPLATTVLARELELAVNKGRPVMKQLKGRVEALERFAGTGDVALEDVALEYAGPYLADLLDGENAQGQLFLQFAKDTSAGLAEPLVGLAGKATAGLAQVNLPIAALSRRFGAVAGELPGALDALKEGDLDLGFLTSGFLSSKLLGLVDLGKLIPQEPKPKLDVSQQMKTDVLDGVTTQTLTWNVPVLKRTGTPENPQIEQIEPLRDGFLSLEAIDGHDPHLNIVQETKADAQQLEMRSTTSCTLNGLALKVYMSDDEVQDVEPIVTIPFEKISFVTRDGGKPDFDVVLGRIEFGGILRFVAILADFIDELGLSDPPALEVTSTGVRSSFSFDVPAVAIGMFALENIAFSTALDLTFQPTEQQPALLLTVRFASRSNPFRLTVSFLGGGGSLVVAAASDGLALIEGSLSFGACLAINFAEIAKGSVEAMGGVVFTYDRSKEIARLTAFLQIRGEASVLSLITVSLTLLLALGYDFKTEILSGSASVVVEVSVWFFSQSVTIPYEWEAKTGNSDPTFVELMAPAGVTGDTPWDIYCMTYAKD